MGLRVIAASPRSRALVGLAAWILVGGSLATAAFLVAFTVAMRVEMRATEVEVPDLRGLTLESAAERLEPLELVTVVVDRQHDPAIPSDRVLAQVPRPGAAVRRGRKIRLVLSLGGRVLAVPALVGRAARTAGIELERLGFATGSEVRVPSSAAAAGTVLAQVPPPGAPAVPGSRVHRLVSDGARPRRWVMPEFTGRARARAEQWANRVGTRLAVRSVGAAGRPSGTVVGQLPPAGHPVRTGDVVELTVAR